MDINTNPSNNGNYKDVLRDEKGRIIAGSAPLNTNGRKGIKHRRAKLQMDIFEAYEELGGREGLIKWVNESKHNKNVFYKEILGQLSKEVSIVGSESDEPIKVVWEVSKDGIKDCGATSEPESGVAEQESV